MYRLPQEAARDNDDMPKNLLTRITYHVLMQCTQIGVQDILVPELPNRKKGTMQKPNSR